MEASSAQVKIDSIAYYTTIVVGIIQRISVDNAEMFDTSKSYVYLNETHTCLYAKIKDAYASVVDFDILKNITVRITDYYVNN